MDDADMWEHWVAHRGRVAMKLDTFCAPQDRHFGRYRGTDVVLLEIGVAFGGSLEIYREYFGDRARLYGADVDPAARDRAPEGVEVFIGDQEDPAFLASLKDALPRLDIVIDDGGHTMAQQIATFEHLYPHVADDGIYVCEDTHTSYYESYGGGFGNPDTFVEFAKRRVDDLNAHYSEDPALTPGEFTASCTSVSFYSGMIVFEKTPTEPPRYLVNDGTGVSRQEITTKRVT